MQSKNKWIFLAKASTIVFLIVLVFSCGQYCLAEQSVRQLQFPVGYSVGNLMAVRDKSDMYIAYKLRIFADARGVVRVPAGTQIEFCASGNFFKHPECLTKLPRDAFEFIEVRFLSMSDDEDTLCDRAISQLNHISALKGMDLDRSDASDAGLSKLGPMPELLTISACESRVTGTCLPKLLSCKKLSRLRLSNVSVDNESLASLKDFAQLQRLSLIRCELSQKGIEHVSKCANLRVLDIDHNHHLDDKVVPLLLRLTKLKSLCLLRTGISVQGLEQLSRLHLQEIRLPKPFSSYQPSERLRISKAFPGIGFGNNKKPAVDAFTKTIFAPITR